MTHELKPNDYLLFPAFPQFEENKKTNTCFSNISAEREDKILY